MTVKLWPISELCFDKFQMCRGGNITVVKPLLWCLLISCCSLSGLSLMEGGCGFDVATMSTTPGYVQRKYS